MSNLTGATSLANTIRTLLANTKAQLDKAGADLTLAVGELQNTAAHATKQVKIVQAETADLKAALGLGTNFGPAIDDDEIVPTHVTPPPVVPSIVPRTTALPPSVTSGQFETPAPFMGPGHPPHLFDDKGDVKTIQLANGELIAKAI